MNDTTETPQVEQIDDTLAKWMIEACGLMLNTMAAGRYGVNIGQSKDGTGVVVALFDPMNPAVHMATIVTPEQVANLHYLAMQMVLAMYEKMEQAELESTDNSGLIVPKSEIILP